MDSFLAAAHHAVALERETDDAQRAVHQALVAEAGQSGAVPFVVVELTQAFEEAADALMHSAHLIHASIRSPGWSVPRPSPVARAKRPARRRRSRAMTSGSMSTCSAIRRFRSLTRA